jgi:hypothetical protein
MSLVYSGAEPQPSLAWTFESSNVDYVTNLQPSAQVSPGPGQLVGSATLVTTVAGVSNTAVYFPGTGSYMNLGTSSPANFSSLVSNTFVEFWVYPNTLTVTRIYGQGNPTTSGRNYSILLNGTRFGISYDSTDIVSSTTIVAQRWYHVAVSIYTSTSVSLFVDGSLVGTSTTVPSTYTSYPVVIGALNGGYSDVYIRDLRVVQGGVVPVATFTPLASAPFSYASPTYVANMGTTVFTLLGQFVTYNPSGKYGPSLKIQNYPVGGKSNVYINWTSSITSNLYSPGLTVSTWIKYDSLVPGNYTPASSTIWSIGDAYFAQWNNAGGAAMFDGAGNFPSTYTNLNPVIGTWRHYTAVYGNGIITTYLNGSQVSTSTFTNARTVLNTVINIGDSGAGGSMCAEYDDFRIYNTALTAAQVQSVYSSQGAPAPSRAMPLPKLAWDFNGTTTDYVSGLTGTTTGTVSYNASGKYRQSLVITNTAFVNASNYIYYPTPAYPSTFTVMTWIKFNTIGVDNQYFFQISGSGPAGIAYVISLGLSNNINFRIGDVSNTNRTIASSAVIAAGQWYHVAAIIDGYNQTLYVNGVISAGPTPCNTLGISYYNIRLGGDTGLPRVLVNGELDDLRIFDRALTSAQVQSIYNQQGVPGRGVLVPQYIKSATGGDTVQDIGGYRIHTFTTVGTSTFTPASAGNVEVLVVGGGGSGGMRHAGGGGAGGLIYNASFPVSGTVTVTVGDGGASVPTGGAAGPGFSGANSVFGSLTAIGGGYGNQGNGGSGGSGGGVFSTNTVGAGTAGQGNNGAFGSTGPFSTENTYAGGGGGGAGAVGTAATSVAPVQGGAGGIGRQISISGTPVYYAGGGGGGTTTAVGGGAGGAGGLGGGGAGGGSNSIVGIAGTNGTGGGGGCGGFSNAGGNFASGKGGSGIVIVRYPLPVRLTGTPLFTQLSPSATSSAVGAFSLRAVNGTSARAVQVRAVVTLPSFTAPSGSFNVGPWEQTLTSSFIGSGTYRALSSSVASSGTPPWEAFDNSLTTWWASNNTDYSVGTPGTYTGALTTTVGGVSKPGEWLQIQIPSAVILGSYSMYARSGFQYRMPYEFIIAGSNDGTTWVQVDSQTGIGTWTGQTPISFTTSSTTPYTYFRIIVFKIQGTTTIQNTNIGQWTLNVYNTSWNADFYADRLGNLLTAPVTGQSLANWLGGATGYVTKWYDQSGKGNDAIQNTAANQPIIQRATKGPGYMCVFSGAQSLSSSTLSLYNTPYSFALTERSTSTGTVTFSVNRNPVFSYSGGTISTNGSLYYGRISTGSQYALDQVANSLDPPSVTAFTNSVSEPLRYHYGMKSAASAWKKYIYNDPLGPLTATNTDTVLVSSNTGKTFNIGYLYLDTGVTNYYYGEIYELLVFTQSLYDLDGTTSITQIYNNQVGYTGT